MVSVTLKTFPEPPVIVQNINASFPDAPSLYRFVEGYFKALPSLADGGGSGYWYVDPEGYILQNNKPTFVVLHFFFNKTDTAAIEALFKPVYDLANSINGSESVNITVPLPKASYVLPQPGGADSTGKNVSSRVLDSTPRVISNQQTAQLTWQKPFKSSPIVSPRLSKVISLLEDKLLETQISSIRLSILPGVELLVKLLSQLDGRIILLLRFRICWRKL